MNIMNIINKLHLPSTVFGAFVFWLGCFCQEHFDLVKSFSGVLGITT